MKPICFLALLLSTASSLRADEAQDLSVKAVGGFRGQSSDAKRDGLTNRLAEAFRSGQLSREQMGYLSNAFTSLTETGYSLDSCKQCVRRIEAAIQNSGLSNNDRLQLYQAVLDVMDSAKANARK